MANGMVHVIVYVTVMTLGSMMFAKFWIETTNMGAKDVAKQIENTGMQIPGFRKNPVVLERILMRYIPPVTRLFRCFRRSSCSWCRSAGNGW